MDNGELCLPFKAAQEAESKSFDEGFRSAWFRCKIKEISSRKGSLRHRLEYFDYPDEKVRWVKLYKRPPYPNQGYALCGKMELMLRPCYPPFYRESDLPDSLPESDVVVIVNDTWKVGDLVDWWYDGCFWSGRITHFLENDEVQIKLPDPPVGEGHYYRALCKDLRPSLDWSLENGWMVPLSGELGNGWYCARLKQLYGQDAQRSCVDMAGRNEVVKIHTDKISEASSSDDKDKNVYRDFMKPSTRDGQFFCGFEYDTDVAVRKYLMSERSSCTLESSIMNLEEVTCRIRWLKGLLKFGFQWSDLMIASWKFLESREVHLQR